MRSSTEPKEADFNMTAVGVGVATGIVVSSVAFAITQNPVWIGIGIPFGAALGIAYSETNPGNRG